ILGMGDVLTLIDRAQDAFDDKQAAELEKKMRTQTFDYNDFLGQLEQMKKMGPLTQMLGMLPGVDAKMLDNVQIDDKKLAHIEAIIKSMSQKERENPQIINFSRKQRIAKGSGTGMHEVNGLIKQFEQMKKMMKQMGDMGKMGKMGKMKHGGKMKMPFFGK
ncbi:MAG: signal recognition particle protein, partial [Hyphomonadaceae bacterium]|nr:signal recognition particle protein [Clostridia bacterium]